MKETKEDIKMFTDADVKKITKDCEKDDRHFLSPEEVETCGEIQNGKHT